MEIKSGTFLRWSARVLGVAVCLFLSLFALDAFEEGKSFLESLPGFLIHVAPMAVLLVVVFLSWRREWIGGVVFTGLAVVYAYVARGRLDWIAPISGPLLLVGLLFAASWAERRWTPPGARTRT